MHLRAGAHQHAPTRPPPPPFRGRPSGPFSPSGVHDEGPVRAALADEQPAEERQRVGPPEAGDHALVGPADHEVRALAPADLVAQHPPDDLRVLLVGDVEAAVLHPHVVRRELVEGVGQRQLVRLLGRQHGQGRAVVAHVEAALAQLAEGDEGQAVGDVGQPLVLGDGSDQHLHGVVVAAGRAAAQQGEGAVVVLQVEQVHRSCSFSRRGDRGEERPGGGDAEGRPSGRPSRSPVSTRRSAGRRRSGPPPVPVRVRVHAGHPTRCRSRRDTDHERTVSQLMSTRRGAPADPVGLSRDRER